MDNATANIYSVDQILNLFKAEDGKFALPSGRIVEVSRTLRTFKCWGVTCANCKLVGEFFRESQTKHRSHLRLYGAKDDEQILMTMDHIIPLSKSGANHIDNLQPMCEVCNSHKGDEIDLDEKNDVLYSLRSIKDYVLSKCNEPELINIIIKDFHYLVNNIEVDRKDYLLRVTYDKLMQTIKHIEIKHGLSIPFNYITRVPIKR